MKLRRTLSGLILGLGCAITFVGLLALTLPTIQNHQLQLVLQTFQAPASNTVIRLINSGMLFAFDHAWQVIGAGAIAALIGGVLVGLLTEVPKQTVSSDVYRRPPEHPASAAVHSKPESALEKPNPFAVGTFVQEETVDVSSYRFEPFIRQEIHEPSVSAFYKPLLEENRVEEPEAGLTTHPSLPVQEKEPVPHLASSRPLTSPKPVSPAVQETKTAMEAASPRIRSTMGKHKKR